MGLYITVCFLIVLGLSVDGRTVFEECFTDWDLKKVEKKYRAWLTKRHDLEDDTWDTEIKSKELGYTFIYGTRTMGDV